VSTFVLNETIVPRANAAATRLVFEHAQKAESGRYFLFAIPDQESGLPLAAIISAATYDPARRTLTKVAVVQFQDGQPVAYLEAPSARWEGTELVADFTFTQREPNSTRQWRASPRIDIGVPQIFVDIQEAKPNDMTLRELRKSIAGIRVAKPLPQKRLHQFLTELNLRIAAPFCALAFVLVGAPLGVRPQRSTAGLNLGMSMVIIFLYYLFSNVSTIMGRAGQMAPWLAAWMANIVLFTVGGYLYSRVFR
jgi:lipopolysaccharide export system permease protein